jgi:uncharacterized membrane protein
VTVHELLDLALRWVHLIAGIMWIGNSMLFNWLDRNLVTPSGAGPLVDGEIWLLHSGGFYQVEKKQLAPHEMPAELHWFKWQNGITWLSGISLLVVVYYLQGAAFLLDPQVAALDPTAAVALCVMVIAGAWLAYDLIWSFARAGSIGATSLSFALLALAAWGLTHLLSGRAAYIHIGVILGTLMTGNVWLHILPSQRALVAATKAGEPQDRTLALRAKQRSIHNNYMTFPLLFIMISNHFPSTYADPRAWLVLFVLMLAGAGVRHMMNIRFHYARWLPWTLAIATVATALLFALTARPAPAASAGAAAFADVRGVVEHRCRPCHSATPSDHTFPAAPLGIVLDTPEQIQRMAPRIAVRAVEQRSMPFLNRTQMTDDERALLGRWIAAGAEIEPAVPR